MQYSEKDLPVRIHHGEMLVLDDGTELRWESNGEAKAVFVGDSFEPTMELFPNQDATITVGANQYALLAFFEDELEVKKA